MPEDNVDRTLLSIESDLRAINATIKDIDRVRAAQAKLADDAKKASLVGEQSAKRLVKAYDEVKKAAEASVKAQADAQAKATNLAGRVQGATGGLRGLAGAAGLGGVSGGLNVASDIAGLADELPALKEALTGLPLAAKAAAAEIGVAGGVLGVGLIGLTGIILALKSASDEARAEIEKRIASEQDYNAIVARETQGSIDKRLEEARVATETARLNVQTAQKARDDAYEAYQNAGNIFDTNKFYDQFKAANDVLEKNLVTLNESTENERELQSAREDARVVARTLAEAEAELAKLRQQQSDQFVNTEIATLQKAQTLSGEQARERLEAIAKETEAIQQFINTAGQSDQNKAALQARLDNLATEYTLLQTLLPTLIAHNDALAEQAKIFADTAKATDKFNQDLAAVEEKGKEQRLAIQEKYANVAVDLEDKVGKAFTDRNEALDKAEKDADKSRAENQAQANADKEAEETRHRDALAKITRDFNRQDALALQNRDVLAALAAKQARDDAKRDENKSNQDRLDEIKSNLDKQNTAIEDKLREQNESILARYDETTAAAQEAYDKSKAAYNDELSALDSKINTEQSKIAAAYTAEVNALNLHYDERQKLEQQRLEQLNAQAQQYLFKSGNTQPDTGTVIPFASGGNAPGNRTLLVGEQGPELIRLPQSGFIHNAQQTRQMASGGGASVAVNINVNGASSRTIEAKSKETVYRELDRILREAGVP